MRRTKKDGLNLVPFIDIILVLLCITLSISAFIPNKNIKVNLPNGGEISREKMAKFKVVINGDDEIFWGDKKVLQSDIKDKIFSVPNDDLIELWCDKESRFKSFVFIIDILKEKNHANFVIQTRD
ncbi:TonB system transport protein ExbD [Campylobacter iguaniorum]|uniref:biopolymer transporter ExbD n=1 Tax=Campylobacter iguaniorum TaxID=1244531 RepID=UPI00073A0AD3|nr:biopolymer transporter ExbD [Campylobacter iguaniorum]ALV23905.1 TonB system transport protein ExbD [Campylobacter iguaniorum]